VTSTRARTGRPLRFCDAVIRREASRVLTGVTGLLPDIRWCGVVLALFPTAALAAPTPQTTKGTQLYEMTDANLKKEAAKNNEYIKELTAIKKRGGLNAAGKSELEQAKVHAGKLERWRVEEKVMAKAWESEKRAFDRKSRQRPPTPVKATPRQDLSGSWSYSKGRPSSPMPRTPTVVRPVPPNPLGYYSGVSTQTSPDSGFTATPRKASRPVLTWTGFEQARNGASSKVFVQLTASADYEVKTDGTTVVVRLKGVHVEHKNNTRPLDLRYFKTPVRRVTVRSRRNATTLTVTLKRAATPIVTLEPRANGQSMLVLEFPAAGPSTSRRAPVSRSPSKTPSGAGVRQGRWS